jgi:hypothetical protein
MKFKKQGRNPYKRISILFFSTKKDAPKNYN